MKTLGEHIRKNRIERSMLLRELAASLKIDASLLSRIEHGEKRPTREQVLNLAGLLKCDAEEFLIHYLSDRVVYELRGENMAIKAILAAEKKIRYGIGRKKK